MIGIKGRKAQMGSVAKLILIIVSAVILIVAITAILMQFMAKGEIEACRLSVLAQANTKFQLKPTGDTSPFNIKCDKYYVNLHNTKVEGGYDPGHTKPIDIQYNGKKVKKIPALNDYVVNQVLAEEMRKCWYQFGEGKINIFDTSMTEGAGVVKALFGGNDVCFVCSEVNIVNAPDMQGKFTGLIDYLKTTKINKQTMTYFEYFNQTGIGKVSWDLYIGMMNSDDKTYFEYYKDKTYMVVFIKQDKRLQSMFTNQLKTFGPYSLLVPAVIYAAINNIFTSSKTVNNNYYVMVVRDQDLNDFCDVQAS